MTLYRTVVGVLALVFVAIGMKLVGRDFMLRRAT